MNEAKRNIVVSWWDECSVENRLNIYDVKKMKNNISLRFPHLVYIDGIEELNRREGFALVASLDDFVDIREYIEYLNSENNYLVDKPNIDFYEFDRLNRKRFSNFEYVIIISVDWYKFLRPKKIMYSNIIFYDEIGFREDEGLIYKLYQEYLNNKNKSFSNVKLSNIKRLKKYIDDNKKDYYTTVEIANSLNVSDKWVTRYMKDMNFLYNNIGYNHRIKKWYVIK